jgi:hypothetical protein
MELKTHFHTFDPSKVFSPFQGINMTSLEQTGISFSKLQANTIISALYQSFTLLPDLQSLTYKQHFMMGI